MSLGGERGRRLAEKRSPWWFLELATERALRHQVGEMNGDGSGNVAARLSHHQRRPDRFFDSWSRRQGVCVRE